MICIIDYGVGNIRSIQNAFDRLGYETVLSAKEEDINACSHIILPGVGAFADAIKSLQESGLIGCILANVQKGKPILGICLGMQMLFTRSFEDGIYEGLNLIPGDIIPFAFTDSTRKVPHMGWNELVKAQDDRICQHIAAGEWVYFVHSYYAQLQQEADLVYWVDYGVKVPAVVRRGNVYGMQFHPEKSSKVGEQLIRNFVELIK